MRALLAHLSRRRLWLNVFLVSIAVNAALGIWALLVDDFGDTQGKILASSFLVSAMMVGLLVNAAPLRDRILWPVPVLASVASTVGLALVIVALWAEPDSDAWARAIGSILTVAGGATLAGLLGLLRLRDSHQIVRVGTELSIAVLSLTILVAIWGDIDDDRIFRLIGIESVIVAALTLALPAIARFLPPAAPAAVLVHYCPHCAAPVEPVDPQRSTRCDACGLGFRVEVRARPVRESTVESGQSR